MKRALFSLLFLCLVAIASAFGQSDAKSDAKSDVKKACPFNIAGLWRSDRTTESSRMLFSFSSEGYVTLLEYSSTALPQDFEMINTVNYSLDKPAAPKNISFTTRRGNEFFSAGVTWWKIIEYSDDSFTTQDPVSEEKTRWFREQTHRYFLTLAGSTGPLPQGGPALAMWTVLDGRRTEIEALGIQLTKDGAGKTVPVFGPIPSELYDKMIEENEKEKKSNKDEIVLMRFELTEAEFKATHKVYETWDEYVKTHKLPEADPYRNGLEFLRESVGGLNQCGEKTKLYRLSTRERDEILAKHKPPQQPLEYIRMTRKKNDELHVTDAMFPWVWRPSIRLPAQ
jgi:hypothetical protein